jgi:hypothetical protein
VDLVVNNGVSNGASNGASPIVGGCCGCWDDDDRDPRTPTNNGACPIVSANQPHYLIMWINNEVRGGVGGYRIATEVVLLRKLGKNEVFFILPQIRL